MTASYSIETWQDGLGWHWQIIGETNDYGSAIATSSTIYRTEDEARLYARAYMDTSCYHSPECACGEQASHGHFGYGYCGDMMCCSKANE